MLQFKEFSCQSKKHLSMPNSNFEISPIDNIENTVKLLPDNDKSILSKLLVSNNSTVINLVFSVRHVYLTIA